MAKKILLGVLGFAILSVLVIAILVAQQPDTYEVRRSRTFEAPPEVVYAVVSDLGRFEAWSPWSTRDPNMTVTVTGEPGEVGHTYRWSGNDDVGVGRLTIAEAIPPDKVALDLVFEAPFQSEAETAFFVEPADEGSKVTWTMTGENDFVGKAMSLAVDMEQMIGKDYARGLENLEPIVVAEARAWEDEDASTDEAAAPKTKEGEAD